MKVSLCMIARDEAEHVAACLGTVTGLVSEIVLVDTGSTDGTRAVAERFGARVFPFPWDDDFSAARNESIRHARGDFIFWLDADDRVPEASQAELAALFGALDPKSGYLLRSVSPGPNGAPVRDARQLRVFPNDPRLRWEYPVHEQIAAGDLALVDTGIVVVHLGYEDPCVVRRKLERNLYIVDRALAKDPDDCALAFHRATTLLDLGRAGEALAAFRRCERRLRGTAFGQSIPLFKVRAHIKEGRLADALAEAHAGLKQHPGDPALAVKEGELLAALGQLEDAEERLRAELAEPGDGSRARNLLAEVLLVRGRAAEAEREARRVVEERPAFGLAWITLGEALLLQGKRLELEKVRLRLAQVPAMLPGLVALDAIEASSRGDHDTALVLLARELRSSPEDAVLLRTRAAVIDARDGRGRDVDAAVAAALECAPLCVRTRAIARRVMR